MGRIYCATGCEFLLSPRAGVVLGYGGLFGGAAARPQGRAAAKISPPSAHVSEIMVIFASRASAALNRVYVEQ